MDINISINLITTNNIFIIIPNRENKIKVSISTIVKEDRRIKITIHKGQRIVIK